MYYYTSTEFDESDFNDVLDEIGEEPDTDTVLALEVALSDAFARTQAGVHIQTGRLKASGRVSSSIVNGVWQGEITYGAPGTGAEYAWYEARRGGPHDFMNTVDNVDDTFVEAVEYTLPGRSGR